MNVAHGISSFPSWKGLSLTTDMAQNNRIGLLGNPEVLKDHEDSNCTNNITTSKKGEDPQ
jgi:hypothetical protein